MVMKNKAQMHVEIIISFIIFVGFLIFIFVFINPLDTTPGKQISTEEVKQALIRNMSEEMGILSVIVKTTEDCYFLTDVNEYGSNFIEIKEAPRKYTIYFSDVFGEGIISCTSKPDRNFTLGVYYKDEIIFEDYVKGLKNSYEKNYELTKKDLGVSSDFSFSFKDFSGDILPALSVSRESPTGVERDAQEFPVRIIDSSGNIQNLVINVRIW